MAGGDGGRAGPRRTCVGCRRHAHPDDLLRVVATPDGPAVGPHLPGRGAWVHPDPGCVDQARRRRAWSRALRRPVTDAEVAALGEELAAAPGTLGDRTGADPAPGPLPSPPS